MEPKMLEARFHTDPATGCLCRYVRSETEYFRPHFHDYFELFLVMSGSVCHIVNGQEQRLSEGELLFIRDADVHDYKRGDSGSFSFINLAFTAQTLQELRAFLGGGFPAEQLLHAPLPPAVQLTPREKEALSYALIALNGSSDPARIRFLARALLVRVFSDCFARCRTAAPEAPAWLEAVCEKMKEPQNFLAGTARMRALAGRSREHLTRCMKRCYGVTPSGYVTDLRLGHAADLLLVSNLTVTEICYACGFENLSWFYKCFSEKYGATPTAFRRQRQTD